MKHPQIRAGHGGLPPTSNVPWSQVDEDHLHLVFGLDFVFLWVYLATGIGFCYLMHLYQHSIVSEILLFGGMMIWQFVRLRRTSQKLHAMLLNKPRSTEGLTQWSQHSFPRINPLDPDSYRFFCLCGRLVDFTRAEFFQSTRRYALVCQCGRGHFMPVAPIEKMTHFPSEVKR